MQISPCPALKANSSTGIHCLRHLLIVRLQRLHRQHGMEHSMWNQQTDSAQVSACSRSFSPQCLTEGSHPHAIQVCGSGSHRVTTCRGLGPQAFPKPCSTHSTAISTVDIHVHLPHAPLNIACIPRQLASTHRPSAGGAYSRGVWLRVQ